MAPLLEEAATGRAAIENCGEDFKMEGIVLVDVSGVSEEDSVAVVANEEREESEDMVPVDGMVSVSIDGSGAEEESREVEGPDGSGCSEAILQSGLSGLDDS